MVTNLIETKTATMPEHVDILAALGQPSRLRIMRLLALNGELTGDEILRLNGDLKQPTISHHMSILRDARLIESRRDGLRKFYRICPETIEHLTAFLATL
jgi:ArsR family transcriptional regulator